LLHQRYTISTKRAFRIQELNVTSCTAVILGHSVPNCLSVIWIVTKICLSTRLNGPTTKNGGATDDRGDLSLLVSLDGLLSNIRQAQLYREK
jgi:hypothetical protein